MGCDIADKAAAIGINRSVGEQSFSGEHLLIELLQVLLALL